jgi:hypothetical protein
MAEYAKSYQINENCSKLIKGLPDRAGACRSGWGETWLLVEMLLFDETRQHLKAALWTTFTRIDPRTGKRVAHPADFMEWINGTLVEGVSFEGGLKGRLEVLRGMGV